MDKLADVGGDILNIISDHDLAIVTDMSFAEANAMLSAIAAEYNEGSCLSFAAMFIKHNGQIDRKRVVKGKSVSVRVDLGGCRSIHQQTILSYPPNLSIPSRWHDSSPPHPHTHHP